MESDANVGVEVVYQFPEMGIDGGLKVMREVAIQHCPDEHEAGNG